jgi:putative glutamine amidotransferase
VVCADEADRKKSRLFQFAGISMHKPLIGITPDRSDPAVNPESCFFVRRNYCGAVADAGGAPVVLPYQAESVERYLDLIEGLVITGGMFDVDPASYGMPSKYPEELTLKADRTCFERALLRGALARNMPVLGICGGMQLIAIEMGAKLIQHIPSEVDTDIEHKQEAPCSTATHHARIKPGSLLHSILGVAECEVNSLHHQSVMGGNENLLVGAVAPDGVIEAIEVPHKSLCIGVQWHPEYGANPWDKRLFEEFVGAARAYSPFTAARR